MPEATLADHEALVKYLRLYYPDLAFSCSRYPSPSASVRPSTTYAIILVSFRRRLSWANKFPFWDLSDLAFSSHTKLRYVWQLIYKNLKKVFSSPSAPPPEE